jgi:maltose O-acetyltransferase
MKQTRDNILSDFVSKGVSLVLRAFLRSTENSHVRFRMGQLYATMRQCSHENYGMIVREKYDVHPTVDWGLDTIFHGNGIISIGEHTYIGRDGFIVSSPVEAKIIIGRHCAISHSVHIRTAKYNTMVHFKDALESPLHWGNVKIGDYVWIGAHVFICGGVTIGDNSIIGANSVVTKDIPPDTIYGGVPARLIGYKPGTQREAAAQEPPSDMSQGSR